MTPSNTGSRSGRRAKKVDGSTLVNNTISKILAVYNPENGRFDEGEANDISSFLVQCSMQEIHDRNYVIDFVFEINGIANYPERQFPDDDKLRNQLKDQLCQMLEKLAAGHSQVFEIDHSPIQKYMFGFRRVIATNPTVSDDSSPSTATVVTLLEKPSLADSLTNKFIETYYCFDHTGLAVIVTTDDAECFVSQGQPDSNDEHSRKLNALFADLPDEPKARLGHVVSLQKEFRRKAAEVLQPAVDKLLRSPPESFAEKQTHASEINAAMHDLGLGITQVGAETPCSVMAHRGKASQSGWLTLQDRRAPSEGERQRRSAPTTKLGKLTLVEAVREERLSRRGRAK